MVHHKRNHLGIVHFSTAQGGLLLGMCRRLRFITRNSISQEKVVDATLGKKKCGWAVLKRTAHSHFLLLAAADAALS